MLPKPELWPEGIDELESFEYSVTELGNVRTSAPYGQHDDCVMALALAAWPFSKPERDPKGIENIARALAGYGQRKPRYVFPAW